MAGNMEKYYVNKDVFEVFFESTNGKNYYMGLARGTSISRESNTEPIKGGIGAPIIATLKSDDGYKVDVEMDIYYDDISEMLAGVDFEEVADLKIKDVTIGEDGAIVAEEKQVAGRALELKSGAFPKAGKLQMRTILFDPETEKPALELYYIFDKAMPDGSFEEVFNMEEANGMTVSFTPTASRDKNGVATYGRKVFVPIKDESDVDSGLGK